MTAPAVPRRLLPLLTAEQIGELKPELADVIEYRKSGLSVNHIVGCPLECGYCVRHVFDNFAMKTPKRLMTDEAAVAALVGHRYFRLHKTPIQLFNRATDPMLPVVKPHLFAVLRMLDEKGLTNHVLVITRWRVSAEDCAVLNSFQNLRLTVLVTHSGIDNPAIEPVNSSIAADSLRMLFEHAERYKTLLYWRPIVPGLNDSDEHIERARELSLHAHATVFTGLFFRDQMAAYYEEHGLPMPYDSTARRKIMPEHAERRILDAFDAARVTGAAPWGTLFRKTSCGVAYPHGEADYNGHYGIRELCDICPPEQIALCAGAWVKPELEEVTREARGLARSAPLRSTTVPSSSRDWTSHPATTYSTGSATSATTEPSPTTTASTAEPPSAGRRRTDPTPNDLPHLARTARCRRRRQRHHPARPR